MRPIVTDVAWSAGLSVTILGPAKTAEPIEIPFGLWTLESGGPKEPRIRWGTDPPYEGTILKGEGVGPLLITGNTVYVRRRCGLLSNYFDRLL